MNNNPIYNTVLPITTAKAQNDNFSEFYCYVADETSPTGHKFVQRVSFLKADIAFVQSGLDHMVSLGFFSRYSATKQETATVARTAFDFSKVA